MKKRMNEQGAFWKMRSKKYNKLQWVNNQSYLHRFISAGKFTSNHIVLDVGTGTGVVAHAVAPFVKEVIGMDISQDMLEHSNWRGNMYFIKRDILQPIFQNNVFDRVTCRLVFHHILKRRQEAMDNCHRVLKKGGLMILSEGVPPSKRVKKDYEKIFKLKEKRVVFYEEDLVSLMRKSGFRDINVITVFLKNMSIRNWVENSGLPVETQHKIYMLHKDAAPYFKKDYEMVEAHNDCFINMKMLIVVGKK